MYLQKCVCKSAVVRSTCFMIVILHTHHGAGTGESIVTSSLTNQRTDLQVSMSNLANRKHLIKELSDFGITSSDDEFLLFEDSAACTAMEKGDQNFKTAAENEKLIQAIADNFDCNISSPNGLKQTHSMVVIVTQEQLLNATQSFSASHIRRKTKKDIQAQSFPEPVVHRYKGPVKPPIPKKDAFFDVQPLRVLASPIVSLN